MAKVVISPSVHNFADIRPVSRGMSFAPRPNSRLSTGQSRPQSGAKTRTENILEATPRTFRSQTCTDIPLPVSGRRSLSVSSSSNGKLIAHLLWLSLYKREQAVLSCSWLMITYCLCVNYVLYIKTFIQKLSCFFHIPKIHNLK